MPNLVVTNQCQDKCTYCFSDFQIPNNGFSLSQVKKTVKFLKSFNRNSINIVGGEPSLNPDFIPIVKLLLDEGLETKIFTNGKLNSKSIAELQKFNHGEFWFCVNRTNEFLATEIKNLYRKLGWRIQLNLTIYHGKQNIHHIFREISDYKLNNYYRVGIALPVWPEKKRMFLKPYEYKEAADKLFYSIKEGISKNMSPTFDCGFPYCFFSAEQRLYFDKNGIEFSSNCGVIPDILPDFTVIPCFPLARLKKPIGKKSNRQKIENSYNKILKEFSYKPIFDECDNCDDLKSKNCCGGCAALRLV